MVASKDGESVFEADFQRNEESYSLDRVVATVNIIAHEQVVGVGRLSANLEQLSEVVELSMDVSADGDWSTDLLDVRFVNKDFFSLNTNSKFNSCSKMSRFHAIQPTAHSREGAIYPQIGSLSETDLHEARNKIRWLLTLSQRVLT